MLEIFTVRAAETPLQYMPSYMHPIVFACTTDYKHKFCLFAISKMCEESELSYTQSELRSGYLYTRVLQLWVME